MVQTPSAEENAEQAPEVNADAAQHKWPQEGRSEQAGWQPKQDCWRPWKEGWYSSESWDSWAQWGDEQPKGQMAHKETPKDKETTTGTEKKWTGQQVLDDILEKRFSIYQAVEPSHPKRRRRVKQHSRTMAKLVRVAPRSTQVV